MPIVLYRVDERLIHGQVVIGWGSQLQPDAYLVVDDALAEAGWEQDLYRLAVGEGTGVSFHSVAEARTRLTEWEGAEEDLVLLTRDVEAMLRLAQGRLLAGKGVNLGGIHHAEGRTRVRSYLWLDDQDRARVRALEEEGAHVTGRDLPGSLKITLHDLLEE